MIGLVVVSHSLRLAEGVCELAAQVGQAGVRLAAAGGTDDPEHPLGTDAFRVLRAIESVWSEDGVLVFMDLGSALLSAETAVEFLEPERRERVRLCHAPLVEGVVAAATQAAAGAGLEEIVREAHRAAEGRGPAIVPAAAAEHALATLPNRLGLHARPAARLVRLARGFQSRITIENVTCGSAPVDAGGINGLLALGARQGHQLRISAEGPDAGPALAEVRRFLNSGCGDRDEAPAPLAPVPPAAPGQGTLPGLPASPGIAMGPLVRLRPAAIDVAARIVDDVEAECRRLREAIRGAEEETRALVSWARAHAGEDEAGIFDAQVLILEDPDLYARTCGAIRERRIHAEAAWQAAGAEFATRLADLDDPYLKARAADVTDVTARVLRRLAGVGEAAAAVRRPSVVAAHDLTPSEVRKLDPALVLGLCLETSAASAHSVILARAMAIPAVVGLGPAMAGIPDGTLVALDGERGVAWVAPGDEERRAIKSRRESWLAARREAMARRREPARTRDGRAIRVLANISGIAEAGEAIDNGAGGVGVLRTEFLFLGRSTAPTEEEQARAYAAIADVMGERPLVIRTLDVGGDKTLPYIEAGAEANPFLGLRGLRLTLARRDLLRTQLRAILRAGAGHAVEILLPMVSTLAELRDARDAVTEAETELRREGVHFASGIKVGVMIEVPSAVAIAGQLARHAAFFSIGTNDLAQYAMAADRTNARVAGLADAFQPAVLELIRQAVEAARGAGIGATLCGEMAGDPLATPLLIGLGLEEFSVSPPLIPELKSAISQTSVAEAEAVARHALELDSGAAVRRFLALNRRR